MHHVEHGKSKPAGVGRRKCFSKESKFERLHSARILLAFAPKTRRCANWKNNL